MLPKRPQSCSSGTDKFLEDLTRNADRVFYFDEGPRATPKLIAKAYPRAQNSQRTWRSGHDPNGHVDERPGPLSPNG
jgi:hypothetical protein